jgi:hypothetical protein
VVDVVVSVAAVVVVGVVLDQIIGAINNYARFLWKFC